MRGARSRSAPWVSGDCTSTPNTPGSKLNASIAATRTVMPSGSARPCITAIVCGKQLSATRSTGAAPVAGALRTRSSSAIASAAAGGFVEERGVGHLHRRQLRHHRLEREQRFQAALCDLRLVGRVGRVPAGVFEDHPADHGRRHRVVVPEADVGAKRPVARGDRAQAPQVAVLGLGRRAAPAAPRGGWPAG